MNIAHRQPAPLYTRAVPVDVLIDELIALVRIRVAVERAERELDFIAYQARQRQLPPNSRPLAQRG